MFLGMVSISRTDFHLPLSRKTACDDGVVRRALRVAVVFVRLIRPKKHPGCLVPGILFGAA